ncbi:MAG: chromosomal replication initiator protein DnaA [Patescibacteria group bacterium]|nr:chromosomal replication initiator protein DnaA [Patescibacteria group bacterium]MDE1945753.1 chromosomal replication initiator protein DnaA [Patescibacteria group bacterium]
MIENKTLWNNVLAQIELAVSKANFSMWFKDTHVVKQEDGTVYIGVPNIFVKDWLMNKYHKDIMRSLRAFGENVRGAEYVVSKGETKRQEKEVPNANELPLADLYINKEDNLNPKYTFKTFVVGPFNELAYAASQAILKRTAAYNPLFIFGSTGHGKTHLIQAIGNQFKEDYPEKKVYYLSSESFVNDYLNSLNSGDINRFKEKYKKYDTLIIDDIQFLSAKNKTQEEFFHLFNHFHEANKQLIFSSDKHPNFIPDLEDRIKSRFNAGMILEIVKPDFESRIQIFKKKSSLANLTLSNEMIEFLASSIEGNIRELEGILNLIRCQTDLKGRELNINEVKDLIKNTSKPKKNTSVTDVIRIVSDFYGIEKEHIAEKGRKKEVIKPRQVIMYLLREDFDISFPSIGEKVGGRDHSTVIHSYEKVKNDLKTDPELVQEIERIRSMLK